MPTPSGAANPAMVDLVGRLIAAGPKDRPPLIGIVGAQGCGKTTHALKIARALGLRAVIDDWDGHPATFRPLDTLHLTNDPNWSRTPTEGRRCLSFEAAMQRVRSQEAN